MKTKIKREQRHRRHRRVKAKIYGTAVRLRLCVFRSNKHIWAQLIDDKKGKTLVVASDLEIKGKRKKEKGKTTTEKLKEEPSFAKASADKKEKKTGKTALAFEVGRLIAEKAKKLKIEKVVFDRGGYKYHGRVKAVAEGARDGGLKF